MTCCASSSPEVASASRLGPKVGTTRTLSIGHGRRLRNLLVGREAMREAKARVLPWEEWLTDPAHIETALASSGLERIEVHQREYRVTLPTEDYLSMLDVFAHGRFLRHRLGPARWEKFRERVAG